jgi:hypothetical protein
MEARHPDIFGDILKKRELDADLRAKLNKALEEFKGVFKA